MIVFLYQDDVVHHQSVPVQITKEIEKMTRKKVYGLIFLF